MGMMCISITSYKDHITQIGVISGSSLMYFTMNGGPKNYFTKDLKRMYNTGKSIYHPDLDLEAISKHLGFNYTANISQLYPSDNFNFERYTLITVKRKYSHAMSEYYSFVIMIPDEQSMKKHEKYYVTFHKYKFIHNILLPDITNMIFRLIMNIKIDQYYLTGLNKIKIRSGINNTFKRNFIDMIRSNI